jgi:ABC-2 type transport system ATP-binding protein
VTVLPAIEVDRVTRRFGTTVALREMSMVVSPGEIHALLGPNGAGKTTLLRILVGLTTADEGVARIRGVDVGRQSADVRAAVGMVPSGDRTFYNRISGLENLVFFARLYGFGRSEAARRAGDLLEAVGLTGSAHLAVGRYSHGMQKRLAIARALLMQAEVLLVDEATHNLDPEGARRVRELIRHAADGGAGVLWTTQRVEEIRGFADTVTLLNAGRVRFSGSPAQLVALASPRSFLVRLRNGHGDAAGVGAGGSVVGLQDALGSVGRIAADAGGDGEHYLLTVSDGATLGDAITKLTAAQVQVLSCSEARSEIEQAFVMLTEREARG